MRIIRRLLYVSLYSTTPEETANFFKELFQWEVSDGEDGQKLISLDKYHHRIEVYPAEKPGIHSISWEVFNRLDLLKIAKRLEESGTPFEMVTGEAAKRRKVKQYLTFKDPAGYTVEVCYAPYVTRPFVKNIGLLNVMDMVHVTVAVKEDRFEKNVDFYEEVLNFKISDWGSDKVVFTRCSENHHNLAMAKLNDESRPFRHVMFEVETMDDLMKMFYRAKSQNKAVRGPDRHGNCKTMEIYLPLPGTNGEVEIGYNHTKIPNDADWEVVVYPFEGKEFVEFVETWSHPFYQYEQK